MTHTKADRIDLWALTGRSAMMLLMLVLTWYSANLGGSSVSASGFSAATILRVSIPHTLGGWMPELAALMLSS
jgi:hypothetical protein